jgi:glycosyltransferase involved in cell wall biosynthesis
LVFFRGWTDSFEEKIKVSKVKSFLFKMSYAKVDKYIVLGQIFKLKLIALGVPEQTEFFIESTVADSSYLNELDLESKYVSFLEQRKFLFLSRIEKEKGIYIAVDAFTEFLSKYPEKNSCLTIAGDGPELAAVKKYVKEKRLSNIEFAGHVRGEQKKKLLITSHILLFPTYYGEGIPNSILESMLYGMPVVSRTVGGIPDIIQNDVNGYLSESLEPGVFLDFISLLTSDIDLYKKISNNNYVTAKEKYTTEKVRERILKIYRGFN